jgi:hypothetical protein
MKMTTVAAIRTASYDFEVVEQAINEALCSSPSKQSEVYQ